MKYIKMFISLVFMLTIPNVNAQTESKGVYVNAVEEIVNFNNNYKIDKVNDYIDNVSVNTDIETYKSTLSLSRGYTVIIESKKVNNKDVLYTGGKTIIMHGDEVYQEYVNVVTGDIDGDGMINSADLLRVRQHLLGSKVNRGAYFLASDIDENNTINSADLLRVRWHLLGRQRIG